MVWKVMKFGFRKPSLKRSIKARTTGKLKRKVKKTLVPFSMKVHEEIILTCSLDPFSP